MERGGGGVIPEVVYGKATQLDVWPEGRVAVIAGVDQKVGLLL